MQAAERSRQVAADFLGFQPTDGRNWGKLYEPNSVGDSRFLGAWLLRRGFSLQEKRRGRASWPLFKWAMIISKRRHRGLILKRHHPQSALGNRRLHMRTFSITSEICLLQENEAYPFLDIHRLKVVCTEQSLLSLPRTGVCSQNGQAVRPLSVKGIAQTSRSPQVGWFKPYLSRVSIVSNAMLQYRFRHYDLDDSTGGVRAKPPTNSEGMGGFLLGASG